MEATASTRLMCLVLALRQKIRSEAVKKEAAVCCILLYSYCFCAVLTGGVYAGVCIGYIRLPQSQKQCVYLSKVYCYILWEKKFLAVRRVGLMTRREYRVDRPFSVT